MRWPPCCRIFSTSSSSTPPPPVSRPAPKSPRSCAPCSPTAAKSPCCSPTAAAAVPPSTPTTANTTASSPSPTTRKQSRRRSRGLWVGRRAEGLQTLALARLSKHFCPKRRAKWRSTKTGDPIRDNGRRRGDVAPAHFRFRSGAQFSLRLATPSQNEFIPLRLLRFLPRPPPHRRPCPPLAELLNHRLEAIIPQRPALVHRIADRRQIIFVD